MLSRVLLAAVLAAMSGVSLAQAQSVASIGGPAELPPASFGGQQFVDSQGCVFLRAGVGGRVTWAPRLDQSRRALCGYPPTFGAAPAAVAQAAPEPTPAPVQIAVPNLTATAPLATVASNIARSEPVAAPVRRAAAPVAVAVATPARVATTTATAGTTGRRIGCFTNTPVPVRVQLRDGGTAVLCTRGDGTLEGARAPLYPPGSGPGASLSGPTYAARAQTAPTQVVVTGVGQGGAAQQTAAAAPVHPPRGYEMAWEDDRLNPNRARGTAAGQAMQDQVWTRETPARLVSEVAAEDAAQGRVTVSSKSEPAAPVQQQQSAGALYVQVGTFGVPSNAAGARATLQSLGLSTAKSDITKGGRALTVVLAGPFGSSGEAQAALNAARGAGFGDAFIR